MFGRNKVKKTADNDNEIEDNELDTITHDSPQICLFDMGSSIVTSFKAASYNINEASLGKLVKVPNDRRDSQHFLKLNHNSPDNLHEHDIVVFDMDLSEKVDYDIKDMGHNNVTGKSTYALLSAFPEKIFNPIPYAIRAISNEINEILNKESIVIIFASNKEEVHYQEVEINSYENRISHSRDLSNTSFYSDFPHCYNKKGRKMKSPDIESKLTPLLLKYSNDSEYKLVFNHPTQWESNHKQVKDKNFVPLLVNNDGEIISFYHQVSKGAVLVFPCIEDKETFLLELFNNHLSEIFPSLFPFHGQFGWLDNGDYLLPGEAELVGKRESIEKCYLNDVDQNEKSILKLKEDFSFLRELISESGDKLVSSIEHYLRWLEFENVVNLDETNPDVLEEDIQVDCGDQFLVVEIKGIGGTSTDKDCSQVSKIRYRRAEQRNKFDVSGLYIVNHQRYMPPSTRKNPPFTENQIKDSVLDKRGLLTTYELYKAYFLIERGILSKCEVRERLFDYGLVELKPSNLISLGIPQEYFMSGTVAILNVKGEKIEKGMTLFIKKNGEYDKVKVISIKINDDVVDEASEGELGLKLDNPVKNNSEFFIRKM